MDNITILSNTCIGSSLLNEFVKTEYANPLISTEIQDQREFVKITNNIYEYANSICKSITASSDTRYANQRGKTWTQCDYPVIIWKDVEIHAYHDEHNDALHKFQRRLERLRKLVTSKNYIIISICSFHEHRCIEEDIEKDLIDPFLKHNTPNEVHIYVGPSRYYSETYGDFYICIKEWDTIPYPFVDSSFGSQNQVIDVVRPFISKIINKYIEDISIS